MALLSAILGLLWKYMGLCSVLVLLMRTRITRAPRAQDFTNVIHVLDHNNIYLNDTQK